MNKIDLEVMTRMRNEAALELTAKLKRMPTDDEITMEVCRWLANAHSVPSSDDIPSNNDMVSLGYWDKNED
jgi:hypothetical protein